jgi:hypothetical protein
MPFLPLILGFFKNYWKHILIVIIIGSASFYIYNRIYQRGYNVANAECSIKIAEYEAKMTKYKDDLNQRIASIEKDSIGLVTDLQNSNSALSRDIAIIKAKAKPRPTYVIKQGTICSPTPEYIETHNETVERVNKP